MSSSDLLAAAIFLLLAAAINNRSSVTTFLQHLVGRAPARVACESLLNKKTSSTRVPGTWADDIVYRYPPVLPHPEQDLNKTEPIPFRPFRYGPQYPIHMGIKTMPSNEWQQLDKDYQKTLSIRQRQTTEEGDKATRTLPGYEKASLEALQELSSFLASRYPDHFAVERTAYDPDDRDSWGDSIAGRESGAVQHVTNHLTSKNYDLTSPEVLENPMAVAGLLTQDDLALMTEGPDGQYYFSSGSICTAGFWRLEDKIGKSLNAIHAGIVPQFEQKLRPSMERYFQRLPVDKAVERNNYFFQIDDCLSWSAATNGPKDLFDQVSKKPKREPGKDNEALLSEFDPKAIANPKAVWFRTERQTLRRLPRYGAILFTVRTYFLPVSQLALEAGVPGRMASGIRSWPEDVAEYKGAELYAKALLPYLDEKHAEQVEAGVAGSEEELREKAAKRFPL